jgi:hypothetical protein
MDLTKIFVIPFHVKRMEQSIMPPDFSGAYVSCYVAGKDYVEATEKSLNRLSEDGLHPQEILQPIYEMSLESWTEHVAERWAEHTASLPSQGEFEDAIQKGKVVYGPFGSYA